MAGTDGSLAAAVRQALAEAAGYLALVTQTNPRGSAAALLRRPDTDAVLREALDSAREASADAVLRSWDLAGGDVQHETLGHLLGDVSSIFGSLGHLRELIRRAHASVPRDPFTPGVHAPGEHPDQRAAERRAAAVRDALLDWGRKAALRAAMAEHTASGTGLAAATLDDALAREAAGEKLAKRWRSRKDPSACHWCRKLDGVTIGLRESFLPHLGGPVALPHAQDRHVATRAGERKYGMPAGSPIIYAHPPRPYRGRLQGPLLHPFCRCWLEIVQAGDARAVPSDAPSALAGYLSAADVRAMPEDAYAADLEFLRAAVHELDQVLRRLAGGGG